MDQAEGLRNIIKKHEIRQSGRMARAITVTSGKGGVGKTSLSVNLAIQLSRLGKKVIVLDADFGLANIEVMFGLRPRYNLADLMFHGRGIEDIVTYGPENIGFISGGSGINEMTNLTRGQIFQMIHKLEELDKMADVILVDTGAGIGEAVLEFVTASEEVLLVATPEPTSITDAYALLKTLNRSASYRREKTLIKMIANQIRNDRDADELFEKIGLVVNKFLDIDVEYLGAVPYDMSMQKAIMRQEPVSIAAPASPASRSIQYIAGKLEKMEMKADREWGIMQLFSRVIRMKFNR